MPAKNKFYKTFYTEAEFKGYISKLEAEYIAAYMKPIRHETFNIGVGTGTTYGVDMAIIALGRLQEEKGEIDHDFFIRFLKAIEEASSDYCDLFDVDILENHDTDLWWSGAKMDQEIRGYVGENYPAFEKRYGSELSSLQPDT